MIKCTQTVSYHSNRLSLREDDSKELITNIEALVVCLRFGKTVKKEGSFRNEKGSYRLQLSAKENWATL